MEKEANNVVSMSGCAPPSFGEPNQALIATLNDLLEKAKSGRLQSFAGTGFTSDGCRLVCWGPLDPDVYHMLGALEWLKFEYVNRITSGAD